MDFTDLLFLIFGVAGAIAGLYAMFDQRSAAEKPIIYYDDGRNPPRRR